MILLRDSFGMLPSVRTECAHLRLPDDCARLAGCNHRVVTRRFRVERNEWLGNGRPTACPSACWPPPRVSSRQQFPYPVEDSRCL